MTMLETILTISWGGHQLLSFVTLCYTGRLFQGLNSHIGITVVSYMELPVLDFPHSQAARRRSIANSVPKRQSYEVLYFLMARW
jgi:hypothetical protein